MKTASSPRILISNRSLAGSPSPHWWVYGVLAVVVVGLILRFWHLGQRVYWMDEVATSLRVAGYGFREMAATLYRNQIFSPDTILQFLDPNPQRSLGDMIQSLGQEEPQNPPLYYIIVFYWQRWVGSSPAAMRSLSALLSTLSLPLLYWWCRQLFASPWVSGTAIALSAVAFMPISYAQETRAYSLWIVGLLLMNISLWRWLQRPSGRRLIPYSVATAAGLYTFPMTWVVMVGHGLYVLTVPKFSDFRPRWSYLLGVSGAIAAFLPWVWVAWVNRGDVVKTTAWMNGDTSPVAILWQWFINLSQGFIGHPSKFTIPMVALMTIALVYFVRHNQRKVSLFVLLPMGVNSLAYGLADGITHTNLSFYGRYAWPYILGSFIILSYFLGSLLTPKPQSPRWRSPLAVTLLIGVLFACLLKSGLTLKRFGDDPILAAASIINQHPQAQVISPLFADPTRTLAQVNITAIGDIFGLAMALDPTVTLQLVHHLPTNQPPSVTAKDFVFFVSHDPQNDLNNPDSQAAAPWTQALTPIPLPDSEKTILWRFP